MPVWKAEVTVGQITPSLPAATIAPFFPNDFAFCGYSFACQTRATGARTTGIQLFQHHAQDTGFGGDSGQAQIYKSRAVFFSDLAAAHFSPTIDPRDPYFSLIDSFGTSPGPGGGITPISLADNGAGFSAGGTLSMQWDTSTDVFTFATPMGSYVTTGNTLGFTDPNDAAMGFRPISIGVLLKLQEKAGSSADPQSLEERWTNFYGSKDGIHFTGAAMTQTDPGAWNDWQGARSADLGGGASNALVLNTQQLPADYDARISWPGGFPSNEIDYYWRPWLGGDMFGVPGINEAVIPETSTLLSVWCPTANALLLRLSQDDGHFWTDRMIVATGSCSSGTVQYTGGVIVVLFFESSQTLQTESRDRGLTWSTPMPLSITGTNPFLVVGPQGERFYFYCAAGNIQLQRSFDQGQTLFDASPLVVAVASQQTFGAVLGTDGVLVVSYVSGSTYLSVSSRDNGLTWGSA